MNAKHVYTAASVVSAIYRILLTGVLMLRLFRRRPCVPPYATIH